MENINNNNFVDCIAKVYEQAKESKLESEFFNTIENELVQLAEYFKCSNEQSFLLAMAIALSIKGDTIELKCLIDYFDCNPLKMVNFKKHFDELVDNNFLHRPTQRNWRAKFYNNEEYIINKEVMEAIIQNKPIPDLQKKTYNDVLELLEKIANMVEKRENGEISTSELFKLSEALLHSNQHFPLIKKIVEHKLDLANSYFYCYLIWKVLTGNKTIDIGISVKEIYDSDPKRVCYIQNLLAKENQLLKNNLIELLETNFFNDAEIQLSEKSLKMLNEVGLKIVANKKRNNSMLEASKIPTKKLYFNQEEARQLEMIKKTLQDKMFKKTQLRLKEKNLPIGITILLHGSPGTGKTETVLQVAKDTNRDIFKVEISQSKSMWFGESEKIIKRIFTEYHQYAVECDPTPILFLNEADAIISKRKDSSSSNVAQTENAIQNIILEELENFKGILFATTNLIQNLDSAFERRFLFKVELKNPEVVVKEKIWKSKLPKLKPAEYKVLAQKYNFSGGQIENIVRKNEINEIINGNKIDFSSIQEFCNTELLRKMNKRTTIGF